MKPASLVAAVLLVACSSGPDPHTLERAAYGLTPLGDDGTFELEFVEGTVFALADTLTSVKPNADGTVEQIHSLRLSEPHDSSLASIGKFLICACDGQLRIIDAARPEDLPIVATVNNVPNIRELLMKGTYAIGAGDNGLAVWDFTDPLSPQPKGSFGAHKPLDLFRIEGNLAVVADPEDGILTIDVTDPTAMKDVGSLKWGGKARGIALRGHLAYGVGDALLRVVDLSDPAAPTQLQVIEGASHLGQFGYAGIWAEGWLLTDGPQFYTLADPTLPSTPFAPTYLRSVRDHVRDGTRTFLATKDGVELWTEE